MLTGRRVTVREGPAVFEGRVLGVNAEGQLQVKDAQKHVHRLVAAEVRLVE
jgi:biotin-(acetyl-CoA carboxylase) ligase